VPDIDLNGVRLFYEQRGNGDPVVFVHGLPCDYRGWGPQIDTISSEYKTIAYSRRYAFPNDRKGDQSDNTVQDNADDLAALIGARGASHAHILGFSWGGFIAVYLAVKRPEIFRSLTLVSAAVVSILIKDWGLGSQVSLLLRSPGLAPSALRFLRARDFALKELESGNSSEAARLFLDGIQNGRTDLPPKSDEFARMTVDDARTIKETTLTFPTITLYEVRRIKIPTLVMWGQRSAPWDSRINRALASSIQGSERFEVEGTGHYCLYERPEVVFARLKSFIRHQS